MKKLIFLDIDGTLTPAGTNIPPLSAIQGIENAKANGHLVFLCTGRNPDLLKPLLKYNFSGFIACSGGYVVYQDKVLLDYPMKKKQLEKALELLHKEGVLCTIEGKNGTFADSNLKEFLGDTQGGNSEFIRWRKMILKELGIRPMQEYDGQAIYKIVMMAKESKQLEPCKKELGDEFNFVIQDMPALGCVNGEMIHKDFNKGVGIKKIVEYLGRRMQDTIGFGDSINDIEMMEVVGTSVCMENGSDILKQMADMICPAVEEDGIYKAFIDLGLI